MRARADEQKQHVLLRLQKSIPTLSPVDQFLFKLYPNDDDRDNDQYLQSTVNEAMGKSGYAGAVPPDARILTRAYRISLRESIRFGKFRRWQNLLLRIFKTSLNLN